MCDFSHSFQLNPHSFHSIVRPKCSCYCAPEILLACNEKIDTWSYGCLLYELVTGRPLFDFESFKEMSRFLTPTYLSTLKFEFEEYGDSLFGLAGLLKKLLCYEPEDRLTA